MTAEQSPDPSQVDQSRSNFGIGNNSGNIGNGARVAGVYNDHSVTNNVIQQPVEPTLQDADALAKSSISSAQNGNSDQLSLL